MSELSEEERKKYLEEISKLKEKYNAILEELNKIKNNIQEDKTE